MSRNLPPDDAAEAAGAPPPRERFGAWTWLGCAGFAAVSAGHLRDGEVATGASFAVLPCLILALHFLDVDRPHARRVLYGLGLVAFTVSMYALYERHWS